MGIHLLHFEIQNTSPFHHVLRPCMIIKEHFICKIKTFHSVLIVKFICFFPDFFVYLTVIITRHFFINI